MLAYYTMPFLSCQVLFQKNSGNFNLNRQYLSFSRIFALFSLESFQTISFFMFRCVHKVTDFCISCNKNEKTRRFNIHEQLLFTGRYGDRDTRKP